MASTVLSGASNPSYTNNTGQNVRVVINFMSNLGTLRWAGVSISPGGITIGRNLAFYARETFTGTITGDPITAATNINTALGQQVGGAIRGSITTGTVVGNNAFGPGYGVAPTELMLSPNQTFSAVCDAYNIVIIPENG